MGILFVTAVARYDAKPTVVRPASYRPMPIATLLTEPEIPPASSTLTPVPSPDGRGEASPAINETSRGEGPLSPETVRNVRPAAPQIPAQETSESSSFSRVEEVVPPIPISSSSSASAEAFASESSSASSVTAPETETDFPPLVKTSFPVGKTPNWGAMRTPAEWNRTYGQMTTEDFVSIPRYDLATLTIPMETLTHPVTTETIPVITAKLFYSTRYMGSYDLDAGEHNGSHYGIDLKLARGTPIGSIGGGRVSSMQTTQRLGIHVIIEHRLQSGETYYSVYGHLDSASVSAGQDISPGQTIGTVGMTGNTSAPHMHLQVDKGAPGEAHVPAESEGQMAHPITFISKYRNGE